MSNDFCKVFDTELGQVVVMKDTNDEGNPCLCFYAEPSHLGVSCVRLSFKDNDEGYNALDVTFDNVTKEKALTAVDDMFVFNESIKADL